jgi:hypothetical protein
MTHFYRCVNMAIRENQELVLHSSYTDSYLRYMFLIVPQLFSSVPIWLQ